MVVVVVVTVVIAVGREEGSESSSGEVVPSNDPQICREAPLALVGAWPRSV